MIFQRITFLTSLHTVGWDFAAKKFSLRTPIHTYNFDIFVAGLLPYLQMITLKLLRLISFTSVKMERRITCAVSKVRITSCPVAVNFSFLFFFFFFFFFFFIYKCFFFFCISFKNNFNSGEKIFVKYKDNCSVIFLVRF